MPYKIRKLPNSDRYKVFNSETGKVHSEHATKKNAKSQMRLLYSLDNGDSQFPKEDQSDETAGEGINHKGRKKGAKNKNKKAPKPIVFGSRIPEEEKAKFHEPLTRPIGNYITTWRWVLYREKEKQGITYPIAMKQHALKELYYKLKAKCDAIDEALRDKAEEEGDDPDDVPKTFTTEWLEANWDKYSKRLPQLWQEQLCGKSGRKPPKPLPSQSNNLDKYFKPPQPPPPPPPEDEEPPDTPQPPPNIHFNIEEKDDAGDQGGFQVFEAEKDPEDIEVPTPTPAVNIEKAVINVDAKIQELIAEGEKHGLGVVYEPHGIIGTLVYLHLLEKYSNNCAVITTDTAKIVTRLNASIAYEGIPLRTDWKTYPDYMVKYLGETLQGCINRGIDLILVPLDVMFYNNKGIKQDAGHANVLVIRPLIRVAERFEPHGAEYGNSEKTDKIFNKALKILVEDQLTQYIGEFKFRTPEDICPNSKGFQSFEGKHQPELLRKEGGGFCMMWSCFLMELVLLNPDYSTKQIIDEAFRITNKEPKALKDLIRGYVKACENMLDQLLKNVAGEEFKFVPKSSHITKTASDKLRNHKTLLQNYALAVIFNLNSVVKPPLNQSDKPVYEETELSDATKADKELKDFLNKKTKKDLIRMLEGITLKNGGKIGDSLLKELKGSGSSKDKVVATITQSCNTGTRIDGQLVRDWYASNP